MTFPDTCRGCVLLANALIWLQAGEDEGQDSDDQQQQQAVNLSNTSPPDPQKGFYSLNTVLFILFYQTL